MKDILNLEEIYSGNEWRILEEELKVLVTKEKFSFVELTQDIIEGDFGSLGKEGVYRLWEIIRGQWSSILDLILTLMAIVFLSSFITIIKKSFQKA